MPSGLVRFVAPNLVRGAEAVGILDTATKRVTLRIDSQHAFAFVTPPATQLLDAGAEGGVDAAAALSFEPAKTGVRENVSGFDCEDWEAKRAGHKFTACVYDGIAYFDIAQLSGSGVLVGLFAKLLDGTRRIPLRLAEYDEKGQLLARMETTKLDRHALPAEDFGVPEGYTEVVPSAQGHGPQHRRDLPR